MRDSGYLRAAFAGIKFTFYGRKIPSVSLVYNSPSERKSRYFSDIIRRYLVIRRSNLLV